MAIADFFDASMGFSTRFAKELASTGRISSAHPLYEDTTRKANELARHFERDTDLSDLLSEYRPYELKAIHDYRLSISEQVVWSYSQKIIGLITSTLFHPQIFHISYPEDIKGLREDEQIRYLFEVGFPFYQSFESFMSECLTREALVDANSWVVVKPELADFSGIPSNEFRTFYPEIIPSENVLEYGSNYLHAISTETTTLQNGREGYVFYTFADGGIIVNRQTGITNKGEPIFDQKIYFEKEGLLFRDFVFQIGGILAGKGRSILEGYPQRFYLSPLEPCVPIFNDAARQYSDVQAAIVAHLHPQKYEMATDCDVCDGTGYVEKEVGGEFVETRCTANGCHGGKVHSGTSPKVAYIVEPNENNEISVPAGYIQQDIKVIEKMIEHFYKLILEGARVVNMDMLFEKNGNANETARAKEIDRDQLHILFSQIASVVFPLSQKIANSIIYLRLSDSAYNHKESFIDIRRPTNFDTTTVDDALNRVKIAKESGIHDGAVDILMREAIIKLFGQDSRDSKTALLLMNTDPATLFSPEDMMQFNAISEGRAFSVEDITLKANLLKYFREALNDDPYFSDMPQEKQLEVIKAKAKADQPNPQG